VELPLTPAKLLSVIEGRNIAGAADHATPAAAGEMALAGAAVEEPSTEAAAASPVSAQAAEAGRPVEALDGDWNMLLATPMGPQEMRGHFETDGVSLSGYLSSAEGRQTFTGTVKGNRLKFDLKVEKPMKITLKYDIAVEGDRLSGKVKMGIFGSAKLTGERAVC
jgi:carbon-monoxide dehydrogenase large subunit